MIDMYKNGFISSYSRFDKMVNFMDFSNLFRFSAILFTIIIIFTNKKFLLFGVDKTNYNYLCQKKAQHFQIPYRQTDPHNLFFSHLKLYGIMAIFEAIYLSLIIKKIANENNYHIFLAIALYSLLLGAGLYSYWLFLTIIVMEAYSIGVDSR